MFKEDLENIKTTPKDIKSFSRLVGGIFILLGGFFWWRGKDFFPFMLYLGVPLVVVGEIYYKVLTPVYKVWMFMAVCMGFVMSRVILSVIFFFILTPISWAGKLFGTRFIDTRFRLEKESYWIEKECRELRPEDYEKQF